MDLHIWLPAMFVLGLVSLFACVWFIDACDHI